MVSTIKECPFVVSSLFAVILYSVGLQILNKKTSKNITRLARTKNIFNVSGATISLIYTSIREKIQIIYGQNQNICICIHCTSFIKLL